ncbi:midnolin-like isoform X1 [Cotesia glomerata]|uniref:midnolin-like isoform X1 n=1 Tax=Cotesia glomerata TaxID=32391 RepID=UPI001D00669F|nr:midnolin-like isoform X1 [Cotesia glomerata]
MDGSSKQPSSDVTAMDGSGSNKSSNSHRTNTNTGDTDSSGSSPTPLTATAGADPEYCSSSSSTAVAMMTTSGDIRSNSFALPTPIPPLSPGCGCMVVDPPTTDLDEITISITPTTGGQFELVVERNETIENLKKIISKRLKVAKERICLLHRERQLREGTLKENCLQDGSRLTLLPSVETGLMGQRPEQSVMQALENLNDSQVNDFLSGKAPLNLTMRLGDQMMLIQLQLSTVTPSSPHTSSVGPSAGVAMSSNIASPSSTSSSPASPTPSTPSSPSSSPLSPNENIGLNNIGNTSLSAASGTSGTSTSMTSSVDSLSTSVHRRLSDHLGRSMRNAKQNGHTPAGIPSFISSLASALHAASCSTSLSTATTTTNPCGSERTVSPPTSTSSSSSSSASPSSSSSSPSSSSSYSPPLSPSSSRVVWHRKQLLHYRHPNYHHHHPHHHHHSRKEQTSCESVQTSTSSLTSLTESANPTTTSQDSLSTTHCTPPKKKLCTMGHQSPIDVPRIPDSESGLQSQNNSIMSLSTSSKITAATLDTRALAEASRNLTQKLKQLSSEEHARRRQGAIIESMHHHGKGVYSGTFSGTLNPALQDRHGRPKRDISTIIHILNDLLCATPLQNNGASTSHYRHHRHSSSRQPSSGTSSAGSTNAMCGVTSPNGNLQDASPTPEYSIEELSKENEATKGKMRRLRLVMEQRRAKRKARRQARAAPYTTQWAAVTPESNADDEPAASSKNSTEQQSEPELQPCSSEPVVA